MTDDQVIEGAADERFELCWRPVGGRVVRRVVRGDDERFPAIGETGLAISYMRDRPCVGRMFA